MACEHTWAHYYSGPVLTHRICTYCGHKEPYSFEDRFAALERDLAAMTKAHGVAKCMHIAETQATEQLRADLAAAQAERDDANNECGFRIKERDEARADAVALREQYGRLCDIFRVNMLRAFPDKSHAEIDAAIDAARKEGA